MPRHPLTPIDHAIALVADIVATGDQLVRAEKVYTELIDFRRRTTVVEEDRMSEQVEIQGEEQTVVTEPSEQVADTPSEDTLTAGPATADTSEDMLGI